MALNGVKYVLLTLLLISAFVLFNTVDNTKEKYTSDRSVSLQAITLPPAELNIDDGFIAKDLYSVADIAIIPNAVSYADVSLQFFEWPEPQIYTPIPKDERQWMRLNVKYNGASYKPLALTVEDTTLDVVELYVLDDRMRILSAYNTGAWKADAIHTHDSKSFHFPFTIKPGQKVTLLLGISDGGMMTAPIALWDEEARIGHERRYLLLIGTLVGALFILCGYSLVTYVLNRTQVRFWFAISSVLMLFTVLATEGFIRVPVVSPIAIASLSLLCFSLMLGAMAKVHHGLIDNIPTWCKALNFALPAALFVSSFLSTTFEQTQLSFFIIPLAIATQLASAQYYSTGNNTTAQRLLFIGWMLLILAGVVYVNDFLGFKSSSNADRAILIGLFALGMLSFVVAISASERLSHRNQLTEQEQKIHDLHHFYELFKNSAEGLYTSTLDGELISINPAMCQLFGYDDEASMLASVGSTSDFYASENDRDLLLGELIEQGVVLGREIKGKKRNGAEFWFSLSCQMRTENGSNYLYGSIFDVTEKKQSSISLEYMATHDPLTGVYNRREFEHQLQLAVKRLPNETEPTVLLYLDLDRFKIVNDTCGHKAGDSLIKELAQILQNIVQDAGIMARLGGDEFAVLLPRQNEDAAYLIAMRLLNAVHHYRFIWENRIFTLGVSIGLVDCAQHRNSPEQLISMADAACYVAKDMGRNQIHRYRADDESLQRYEEELNWVSHINDALQVDKFELYYQHYRPLNRELDGDYFEILLRMNLDGDIVPPNAFLPSAERYDLSAKVDRWVVENTFKWIHNNPEKCENLQRCNINLSGHSLADRDLKLFVLNAFEKYAIPYEKICFEITETMAIVKLEETLQFMRTFRQMGCKFALDDFGSGFSSYAYLKSLPVDCVKIDGSFVRDILTDHVDLAMVSSIKDVAKAMGMETVAEFVENENVMTQLGKLGVDYAQGYGVAKPSPLEDYQSL